MDVVVNWLVQGAILALAAAAWLRMTPRSRTRERYGLAAAAYLSLVAVPAVAPIVALTGDGARIDGSPGLAAPLLTVPLAWWTSASAAMSLWVVWFGMHAAALARSMAAAYDTQLRADPCPHGLLARLPHWSRVSGTGRSARVVVSDRVRAAGLVGCRSPVIAIAPRLLEHLSAGDLDRVLVHEWAHLQRRDDLAHLVQRVTHAIVGWHPAAWWFERQLELEREAACDEIAVRVTGSAKQYARCLVTLASLGPCQDRPIAMLAVVPRSRLHRRVERILTGSSVAAARAWRAPAIAGALGLAACVFAAGSLRVATSAAAPTDAVTTIPARIWTDERRIAPTERSPERPPSVSSAVPGRDRRQGARADSAARNRPIAPENRNMQATDERASTPSPPVPALKGAGPPAWAVLLPLESPSFLTSAGASAHVPSQPAASDDAPTHPKGWARAADAGLAVGRVSHNAGIATAGVFKRFGKKLSTSF